MARHLPPLNALRAFEAAARHLSFTKAARELHVTQAAVSHQIKGLEEYLGVPLFHRHRKAVLLTVFALSPLPLLLDPTLFGIFEPHATTAEFMHNVALMWLAIGLGGLIFRTVHLFFLQDVQTGLVWMTKILTDPFHDFMLYYRAPLHLMRGELIDPMWHVQHGQQQPLKDAEASQERG